MATSRRQHELQFFSYTTLRQQLPNHADMQKGRLTGIEMGKPPRPKAAATSAGSACVVHEHVEEAWVVAIAAIEQRQSLVQQRCGEAVLLAA